MGQESSQVAGDTQNSNDGMIKPKSGGKEYEHPHEAEDREGNAIGRDPLTNGAANAIELPKMRKKRRSSSFSQMIQRATETKISQHSRGEVRGANRKKAQLESKAGQLRPVVTAAVSDTKSHYSDRGAADGASEDPGDNGENPRLEFDHEAAAIRLKPLRKSRKSRGSSKAAATGKVKKSKSISSFAMKHGAMNSNLENPSQSFQHSATRGSAKVSDQKTDSNKAVSKKRKSDIIEGDFVTRPRKRPHRTSEISNANSVEAQTDEGRSLSDDAEFADNSSGSGHHMSPPATSGTRPVSTPHQNRRTGFLGDPSYEPNVDVPDLSPLASTTNDVGSILGPVKAAAYARNDQQAGSDVQKGRILPRKRATPVTVMMTPGKSESVAENMALIDSTPRGDQGPVSDAHIEQLGIYNRMATPQTSGKRRRRLPVDDDILEEKVTKQSEKKKTRKRTLKPKKNPKTPKFVNTPETNAPKARANKKDRRNASSDLDESAPESGNRQHKKDSSKVLGRFSAEEISILDNELLKHREMFNMSEYDQNQLIHDQATSAAEFWKDVCEALPGRPRQAIMKTCRRKYHNYGIRGNWTKEDDQQLREAYDRLPRQWKEIGRLMGRHPEDVRDRWRNYGVCGDNQKKDFWTQQEEHNLRLAVGECIQAVKELKAVHAAKNPSARFNSRPNIELVDWLIVSEKLGHTRSRLQCSNKWKQIMKVEIPDNDEIPDLDLEHRSWRIRASKIAVRNMRRDDYLDLLLAIQNSQAGKEGTVPWKKIGDMNLRTKWSCMDRKVAWKKLRATVPGNEDMKLQDIVTQLIDDLPSKDLVDAQFVKEPSSQATPRPALRAASRPLYRDRPNQEGSGSKQAEPSEQRGSVDDNDLYLNQGEEDEFDPDDIEGPRTDSFETFQNLQDVVRGVIEEDYDYEISPDDAIEEEADKIISDNHDDSAESVDLDGPSQQVPSSDDGAQLRSRSRLPLDFKDARDEDASEGVDTSSDSDSDVLVAETPVRRPTSMRFESVDLDES